MSKRGEIYRCARCGNMLEVVIPGTCVPECCGEPMDLLVENTVDAAREKHVPVISRIDDGWRVSVGSVEHPMTEAHYIQWIELETSDGIVSRKYLTPSDKPVAEFKTGAQAVAAREYCNLHGLWKA